MDDRIKVLMVPSDTQGVGHFRNIWIAQEIQKNFNDILTVDIDRDVKFDDYEKLSKYDIIHFHRQFGPFEQFADTVAELKKRNVIIIMDIDDYWEPPQTHPLYQIAKAENLGEKIQNNIKLSDYITTTTERYKKHIEKLNKNVFVIPNAIDTNHKMWQDDKTIEPVNKCRIAWIGGSSHLYDLKQLEQSFNRLNNDVELHGKYQFIMCGYDTRGTITQIMPNGERRTRKIKPSETIWNNFEKIFTSNYQLLYDDKEYVEWLKSIKKESYKDEYKKNYIRRWTLPLTKYGLHYNYCDVCLAPIESTETFKDSKGTIVKRTNYFNEVKSELKIIETGMKHKALIAQDFGVYHDLLIDGETALLVSDNRNGWYKAMKKVILDKKLREKLADNLHNFVKDKYSINNITKQRIQIYKQIIKEKKNKQ